MALCVPHGLLLLTYQRGAVVDGRRRLGAHADAGGEQRHNFVPVAVALQAPHDCLRRPGDHLQPQDDDRARQRPQEALAVERVLPGLQAEVAFREVRHELAHEPAVDAVTMQHGGCPARVVKPLYGRLELRRRGLRVRLPAAHEPAEVREAIRLLLLMAAARGAVGGSGDRDGALQV
jgi:hypothetical protein